MPVVAPFFFRFDHRSTALDWRFTHAAQAEAWIRWEPPGTGCFVRLDAQAGAPWGKEGGSPAEPPGEETGEPTGPVEKEGPRGGILLRVSTGVEW